MSFRFVGQGPSRPGLPSPNFVSPGLDDAIPVSTFSNGATFSANNFPGFTTPATTVANNRIDASPVLGIFPTGDTDFLVAQSNRVWRDTSISAYSLNFAMYLRISGSPGSQTALYFSYDSSPTGGNIEVGIVQGANFSISGGGGKNFGGLTYPYYKVINVAAAPEGIAAGFVNSFVSGANFKFGCNGFNVFLQYKGIDLVRYTEWRCMKPGTAGIWAHSNNAASDITVHYSSLIPLFSYPEGNVYDPRDFGMRAVAPVTGSMSAASNQLVLNAASSFQMGDQIIVETGGEAGIGAQGTIGVGGTWPALNYANLTAMNADTSQPFATYAYLQSPSTLPVYFWNGTTWINSLGVINAAVTRYFQFVNPIALVATVTAVSADTKTLTLSKNSAAATTNANIYLDCLPSYFVVNQAITSAQFSAGSTVAPFPVNITLKTPPGTWAISNVIQESGANPNVLSQDFKFVGSGVANTNIKHPAGTPNLVFNPITSGVNNIIVSDFSVIGNVNVIGGVPIAGLKYTGPNTVSDFGVAFLIPSNNGVIANINGTNTFRIAAMGGTNPTIKNINYVITVAVYEYIQWVISLNNCTGGVIQDCSVTSPWFFQGYEMFACNGAKILRCGGQNCKYSTNSSTSWTIDFGPGQTTTVQITANCIDAGSHSGTLIDEAVINVNDNAFGSGNTGIIINPNITQTGFAKPSTSDSVKFIQIAPLQTNVTVQGEYPGTGGCSTTLGGIMLAPDFVGGAGEYGSMAVLSDANNTVVNGIRIKGAAIGTPGHSSHWGNISISASAAASSQVQNCVADVVQPQTGLTLSGNQTNIAYGGC